MTSASLCSLSTAKGTVGFMVWNYMGSRRTSYLEALKLLIFFSIFKSPLKMVLKLFCHFIHSENSRQANNCKQLQFHETTQECNWLAKATSPMKISPFSVCVLMEVSGHEAVREHHDSKLVSLIIWAKKLNSFGWPAIKQVILSSVLFLKHSFGFSGCIHDH